MHTGTTTRWRPARLLWLIGLAVFIATIVHYTPWRRAYNLADVHKRYFGTQSDIEYAEALQGPAAIFIDRDTTPWPHAFHLTAYDITSRNTDALLASGACGNGVLRFRSADEASRTTLQDFWRAAMAFWALAIAASTFNIQPAEPCDPADNGCLCSTRGIDPQRVLKVMVSPDVSSSCIIGFRTRSTNDFCRKMQILVISAEDLPSSPHTASEHAAKKFAIRKLQQLVAHELGHAIGLMHEHQMPGAYDVHNSGNPVLVLHIESFRGYKLALTEIMEGDANHEDQFQGKTAKERLALTFGNILLAKSVLNRRLKLGHLHGSNGWRRSIDLGRPFDYQSIMLYNGITHASRDARGALLPILEDISSARSRPDGVIEYDQVFQCGVADPGQCTGPSAGDIARVAQLHPLSEDAARVAARMVETSGYVTAPAFRPMRVVYDNYTTTIRPLPAQTLGSKKAAGGWLQSFVDILTADIEMNKDNEGSAELALAARNVTLTRTVKSTSSQHA